MHSTSNTTQRDAWLDALKGLAILCIIIGHSIERMQTGTGYINAPLHFVDVFVNRMHIYIFFLVSGFLYARFDRRRLIESSLYTKLYVKKKFIDYMLPYLIFAVLIWVGKMLFSSYVVRQVSLIDLILMLLRPVAFMWFIYVLFVICMIVLIVDKTNRFDNRMLLLVSIILIVLYLVFLPEETLLKKVPQNLIVFVFGMILYKYSKILDNNLLFISSSILSVILAVMCFIFEESAFIRELDVLHSIIVPFVFFSIFYRLRGRNFFALRKFGEESLYLYIIHPVAINLVRMIFIRMHISNIIVWLFCLLMAGVSIPYFYSVLAKKWSIFEIWFKPRKYIEASSRKKLYDDKNYKSC